MPFPPEVIGYEPEPQGPQFYIFGPTTTQVMRLVPRKWWQFWKPRYVEEWRTWETPPPKAIEEEE